MLTRNPTWLSMALLGVLGCNGPVDAPKDDDTTATDTTVATDTTTSTNTKTATDTSTSTDTTTSTNTKTATSTDTTTSTDTSTGEEDTPCSDDFPSGQGPACCTEPNMLNPDGGRATCDAGAWVCATGDICMCNGVAVDFECFDDCAWTEVGVPGCIFSDHWECFEPTPIASNTCP